MLFIEGGAVTAPLDAATPTAARAAVLVTLDPSLAREKKAERRPVHDWPNLDELIAC